MTQRDMILKHLRTHKKGLTQREAWEKYGCSRLAAVVAALREKGYKIETGYESKPTRYGRKARCANYFMVK